MIKIFHKTIKDKDLAELGEFRVGSWLYVEDPGEEELDRLTQDFALDAGLLKDALDPYEVPRFEIEDEIVYVFTRVPGKEDGRIVTEPLLVAVAPEFILTISRKPLPFFEKIFSGKLAFATTQKTKLLLQIFSEITTSYNTYLTSISRDVRRLSVDLEKIENRDIIQFVIFEGILNDFLGALVPTSAALNNLLSAGKMLNLYDKDKDLIEDLFLSTGQLTELCNGTLKTIVNIREACSNIISNNLSRVMKLLTALTIIITVPTSIINFYSMNVRLPFAQSPWAFWVVLGATLSLSAVLLGVFLKKRWL